MTHSETTPATPEGDAISRAMSVIKGLMDQAYMGGSSADRWLERADEVFHDPAAAEGYAEYAQPLPQAFLRSIPPQDGEREKLCADLADAQAEARRYKLAAESQGKIVIDMAGAQDAMSPQLIEAMLPLLTNPMIQAFEARNEELLAQVADLQSRLTIALSLAAERDAAVSEIAALTAQPVAQEPVAGTPITMTYRNYRGEIDRRTVVPTRIWFGSTDWHPEPGWLMSAYDLAKAAHRDFALADCQFAYLAHPATPAPVEAGMRDWFSDCRVLMANLDAMISHTGEAPEDEDGFMVDEIREAIALRAQSSPVVPVTPPPMSQAALDVFAERQRQISAEGWTPEHDDDHDEGELAAAAATYALSAAECIDSQYFETWPWAKSWWKPTTTRRDLVKAGALILAEMERLDRAAPVGGEGGGK